MDPGRKLFEELREGGKELLHRWLQDGVREDLHLDFKRKSHPHEARLNQDDQRNFSRALSGFANSDSGIIVWGVGAPGVGIGERTSHPITEVLGFAEHLDAQISRAVNPVVDDVENLVIYTDAQDNSGYVITYVPRSSRAPHRAEYEGLKQYYKRYGESFKVAEHYELEYMFGSRHQPSLKVFWTVDSDGQLVPDKQGLWHLRLRLGVTNIGHALAHYVCMRVRYPMVSCFQRMDSDHSDLIHFSKPLAASRSGFQLVTARALQGLVIYPSDYTLFFHFGCTLSPKELKKGSLASFEMYYDMFAQDFLGITHESFTIPGKKICEKLRKKLESMGESEAG